MRIWYHKLGDSQRNLVDLAGDLIRIGRAPGNDLVLSSRFVAEHAAHLVRTGRHWELRSLSENAIQVGPQKLLSGERVLVTPEQAITIYPFELSIEKVEAETRSEDLLRRELDDQMAQFLMAVHGGLLKRMNLQESADLRRDNDDFILQLERDLDELARLEGFLRAESSPLLAHCAAQTVAGFLANQLVESAGKTQALGVKGNWTRHFTVVPEFERDLAQMARRVEEKLELDRVSDISERIARLEAGFWNVWPELGDSLHTDFRQYLALRYLKKQIKDIVFGYGPLEDLLALPSITEIMVVDRDKIYVEKGGVLEKSGRRFVSDDVTLAIIERIVSRVGRRIDKSQPLVDARLNDGSRVNAIIPPLAVSGPCLTIRKFPARRMKTDDLVARGALTKTVAQFLRAAVAARKNILVSGGTGTGKTTLLNCLSDFIPDKERIVTVEDTAELQLAKEHVVRLETKGKNVEGAGEYSIRDLVRNSLRMRPDRIVVGECRGAESLDMLQAMNTGHDGSMTTIHANTARDVILRLEVLVQMAADLPLDSIHRQIASAIHLIVQLGRLRDGSRRVTQVTEIVGYDEREKLIRSKDLYLLEGHDRESRLMPTGALPTFLGELLERNLLQLESFYL